MEDQNLTNGNAYMDMPPPPPALIAKSSGVQSHYDGREFGMPQFKTQLEPVINVDEGEPIRLLTQVEPAGDNNLMIEWFKDGKPLITGSRFSTMTDRGYTLLDILYSIEEDTGTYVCVAQNKSGQNQTNAAVVNVQPEAKVDNNADYIARDHYQENQETPNVDRNQPSQPPQVIQATQGAINVNQGDPIHLECIVEPRNDISLSVDWWKDGKSISLGSRTNAMYDRGYCALDIAYTYPEDSGSYVCVITNSLGQIQSPAVEITCNPDEKVSTKSNLNDSSINQLARFDNLDISDGDGLEFRHQEEQEQEIAPSYDKGLLDVIINEGCSAKFLIKINSHPRARLVWSIDNEEVVSDSINKFYQDGTINYLELSRCTDIGQHVIRVVATNPLGQVSSECQLTVNPINTYSKDLKHIAPENPYKKMAALKRVECTPELSNALKKPKPTTESIVKIERSSEVKSKHHKTSDVIETEKMYDNIAANLKSRGSISTGKRSILNYNPAPVQEQAQ